MPEGRAPDLIRPGSRPGTSPATPSPSSAVDSTPTRCAPTSSRWPGASRPWRNESRRLRTALAEAEERAAHPVVDEATLTASLGQHSAQILRHAHEEAARIVAAGPGRGGHAPARHAEPGRRTAGAHRSRRGRACRRGRAAGRQRTTGGPRGQRADHHRSGGRRPRRSSPGPRTRGGRCSSRSKKRGAACWPTWRRGGARSGSRSSSYAPPGTRWPRRCTACATRWTGFWATWIGPTTRRGPPQSPSATSFRAARCVGRH